MHLFDKNKALINLQTKAECVKNISLVQVIIFKHLPLIWLTLWHVQYITALKKDDSYDL